MPVIAINIALLPPPSIAEEIASISAGLCISPLTSSLYGYQLHWDKANCIPAPHMTLAQIFLSVSDTMMMTMTKSSSSSSSNNKNENKNKNEAFSDFTVAVQSALNSVLQQYQSKKVKLHMPLRIFQGPVFATVHLSEISSDDSPDSIAAGDGKYEEKGKEKKEERDNTNTTSRTMRTIHMPFFQIERNNPKRPESSIVQQLHEAVVEVAKQFHVADPFLHDHAEGQQREAKKENVETRNADAIEKEKKQFLANTFVPSWPGNEASVAWVENFFTRSSYEKYSPHFSIGAFLAEKEDVETRKILNDKSEEMSAKMMKKYHEKGVKKEKSNSTSGNDCNHEDGEEEKGEPLQLGEKQEKMSPYTVTVEEEGGPFVSFPLEGCRVVCSRMGRFCSCCEMLHFFDLQ